MVSITADGWTTDNTKTGFLGMTAQWVSTKDGKWTLREVVIAFKAMVGRHDGDNLGRYMMGLTDRVGITSDTSSKVRLFLTHLILTRLDVQRIFQLFCATLNNASVNTVSCKTIELVHIHRGLLPWSAKLNQIL